jgi:hypothetical protein
LQALKPDGSGFLAYKEKNINGRSCFAIHEALNFTDGCVAVENFSEVRNMLNKGLVKYNNFTFVGFLTVTD